MVSQSAKLRSLLSEGKTLVAPGVHNGLYAKLMGHLGFGTLYMGGAQCNYSHGFPDLSVRNMEEVSRDVYEITAAIDLPVIVDADTGYGNPLNVRRTVQVFEAAGAAALHLEDQPYEQKRSPTLRDVRLISEAEMVMRIKAAVDARRDDNFMIIARTDAVPAEGMARALERMHAYVEAGADGVFVNGPESEEQYAIIPKEFQVPTVALMSRASLARTFSLAQLQDWGYAICIMPLDPLLVGLRVVVDSMNEFRETGRIDHMLDSQFGHRDLLKILGVDDWLRLVD